MTQIEHEIRIAAPPAKVWAVLADLEAVKHYNLGVKHAEYTSAAHEGVGASRRCDLKPKGWVKERVIAWEPQTEMTMELYESEWPLKLMRWRTVLRPDGTGTRVTQEMEYQVKFGLLGNLPDAMVMRRKLDQTIAQVFEGLKRFIETGVEALRSVIFDVLPASSQSSLLHPPPVGQTRMGNLHVTLEQAFFRSAL